MTQAATRLTAGALHACLLDEDGKASCWGEETDASIATLLNGPLGEALWFQTVSSSGPHLCGLLRGGLQDGFPFCEGSAAVAVPQEGEPAAPFAAISSGASHVCALTPSGEVGCWGSDDAAAQATPPTDVGALIAISSGGAHTCALKTDETAVCWGTGDAATAPPEGTFSAIASGGTHACALKKDDGKPQCWGTGAATMDVPDEALTAIASGTAHACGLKADGAAVCWGDNTDNRATPPAEETFTAIACGGANTCGLKADGSVLCWGSNASGQSTPPAPAATDAPATDGDGAASNGDGGAASGGDGAASNGDGAASNGDGGAASDGDGAASDGDGAASNGDGAASGGDAAATTTRPAAQGAGLPAPANFRAGPSDTAASAIELSWDAVPGAAEYRVFYGFVGESVPAQPDDYPQTQTSTTLTLEPDETYWFEVAAVGLDNAAGAKSARVESVRPSAAAAVDPNA